MEEIGDSTLPQLMGKVDDEDDDDSIVAKILAVKCELVNVIATIKHVVHSHDKACPSHIVFNIVFLVQNQKVGCPHP